MPKFEGAKPCPFCGSDVISIDAINGAPKAWCTNCTAEGPAKDFGPDGTAAGAWNDTRTSEMDHADELNALRARAEATEQRAAVAEAALLVWRDALLARVREHLHDPDLHTDHPGASRPPERRVWRVVSSRGVAGAGATEVEALLHALDGGGRG